MKGTTVAALMVTLAGCAPVAGLAGAGALGTVVSVAAQAAPILTASAQLACAVQSIANTLHQPNVSAAAGALCAW